MWVTGNMLFAWHEIDYASVKVTRVFDGVSLLLAEVSWNETLESSMLLSCVWWCMCLSVGGL